ncbi:MAG: S41 family peptidase [Bacteroidota bacterium]
MNRIITLLAILLSCFFNMSYGQDCQCAEDFRFISEKIENEHPGFKKTIREKGQKAYDEWKAETIEKIENGISKATCLEALQTYLTFIKDHHLSVYTSKGETQEAYAARVKRQHKPSIRIIDSNTTYVSVPSFNYNLWKELDHFYDSITTIVESRENLILDIRNNGGGGVRMYKQLLQIIKKGKYPDKVVVLFNENCASACEEVAIKVSKMKKVTTMGSNTKGMVAYGFIKGYTTPNCQFKFIITTKRYPKRMKYEYTGVVPEIVLAKEQDWIKLAVEQFKK